MNPPPPWTLALIGPHGAGKTTLGHLLASRLHVPFHPEIGRLLREEALAIDPDAHALHHQPDFDAQVMRRELERDAHTTTARVVETWHPGNLAFADARSPHIAHLYRQHLAQAPPRHALIQPLTLDYHANLQRLTEPGPSPEETLRFFRDVGQRSIGVARQLRLHLLPPLRTDLHTPEHLADLIQRRLRAWEKTRALRTPSAP